MLRHELPEKWSDQTKLENVMPDSNAKYRRLHEFLNDRRCLANSGVLSALRIILVCALSTNSASKTETSLRCMLISDCRISSKHVRELTNRHTKDLYEYNSHIDKLMRITALRANSSIVIIPFYRNAGEFWTTPRGTSAEYFLHWCPKSTDAIEWEIGALNTELVWCGMCQICCWTHARSRWIA